MVRSISRLEVIKIMALLARTPSINYEPDTDITRQNPLRGKKARPSAFMQIGRSGNQLQRIER